MARQSPFPTAAAQRRAASTAVALLVLGTLQTAFAEMDLQTIERLERGQILVSLLEPSDGRGVAVRASGLIEAPPAEVWPVLRDCEHYQQFLPGVVRSELKLREGNEAICVTEIDLPFPFADLYSEMRVTEMRLPDGGGFERRWTLLRGSYRRNEGSWTLHPWTSDSSDTQRTLAVYEVDLDPQTIVPDFVLRRLQKGSTADLFRAVRGRVRDGAGRTESPG